MSSPTADASHPVVSESGRTWTVPDYTELRLLGGGGFGEVVLATHDATGNQVAIKYLRNDLLADPELAALFRAEAATLEQLDSPYVVRFYEYVEGPSGAAIVMELVDGVALAEILKNQGKTTAPAALVVLYGSLLGLAAAHARGVVHRDYKPGNVLVNGAGASKLTDFGIAALAGDRPMPTGTARYMPPEQFEGAEATPAADVYAATVTFYQCLTGRPPFSGQTTMELYEQHKSASVPMDEVPEPLRPIVARGMAKDPVDRPSDAARLAVELRAAAEVAFGPNWEDRGRSSLAAAALLLALLWPSAGTSAVAGATADQISADGPSHPAQHPQSHPQSQPGSQPQSHPATQTHPVSDASRHTQHEEHLAHEQHLAHEEHLEHVRHEEHLAHLRSEDGESSARSGNRAQSTRAISRPRPPLHLALAGGAAVVVVAAVAGTAVALSSHGGHSPSGSSGGTSAVAHDATGGGSSATGSGGGGSIGGIGLTVGIPTGNGCTDAYDDLVGVEALPVSATSTAASVERQSAKCYSGPAQTVTCGYPYTFTTNEVWPAGTISYTCNSVEATTVYLVNPKTGAWMENP